MEIGSLQHWSPGGMSADDWDGVALTALKHDIVKADGCSYDEAQKQLDAWIQTPEGWAKLQEMRGRVLARRKEQAWSAN